MGSQRMLRKRKKRKKHFLPHVLLWSSAVVTGAAQFAELV